MSDNRVSEFGKRKKSEDAMSITALSEARDWADALMDREFKGRGDKEYLARYRLSTRTGVSESYLYRLKYKTAEMRDVAGSVYRALKIEIDKISQANEDAADRMKAERLGMRGHNAKADEKPASAGVGMDSSQD
ncbi:hypothetical protein ELI01_18840 [Rhizobium leguminosarum]|uniref:hypothetical protein n=1 Tax=Rhizobium leguminosarum TaxID=384 RepID=UPI00103042AA|nr:hypothetical protein [Rhizobium leguminosarum]TAX57136.1 hypothetical protein ELI01_18840 [Rhizobium leguminosarum]